MQAPRFSTEIRARFPALARQLNEVEQTLDEYEARFQDRFTPKRYTGGRIDFRDAARLNMFSAHARARVLTWSVIVAINAELGASLFLSARAHLETAGMMAYIVHQSRRFLLKELTVAEFQERLDRLFLGRTTVFEDDPPDGIPAQERAIRVRDLLASVDNLFFEGEDLLEVQGAFRQAYGWLSDFAHPNLQARIGDHVVEGAEFVFLREPRIEQEDLDMALRHLRLSDFVVSAALQDFDALLGRPWSRETT